MTQFTTTQRGDEVAYDLRGEGPSLVFIGGAGVTRAGDHVTSRTAELCDSLTTIVYDRLGRGESPASGALTLEREIEAVDALIQAAGAPAVLVGHSSGAAIALAAAAAGLDVAGLVLFEAPLAPGGAPTDQWAAEVERLLDSGDLRGALAEFMKDLPADWRERALADQGMVQAAGSLRADAQAMAWLDSAPYAELLTGVRVPTLCLVGEQSMPGMAEVAEAIAKAIPGARAATAPGAYHAWEPAPMSRILTDLTLALGK